MLWQMNFQPLYWPARERLGASLRAAGFELPEQRRILRLPPPLVLPTFLTVAAPPASGR
jgi:hypothetical protein